MSEDNISRGGLIEGCGLSDVDRERLDFIKGRVGNFFRIDAFVRKQ